MHLQSIDRAPEILFSGVLRLLGAHVVVTLHNAVPHDSGRAPARRPGRRRSACRAGSWRTRSWCGTRCDGIAVTGSRYACSPTRPIAAWRRSPSDGREIVKGPRMRIGAFGMIRPYKGLDFVVDVVGRLERAGAPVELRVVGRAADPARVEALLSQLPPGTVSHRLEYVPLPDLVHEIRSSDVLVLGHRSASESGIAQLALGAGIPVIAPRAGALASLLATQDDWLYRPGDADDAAARTQALLDRLARDRTALRGSALALADAAPSWDAMAVETLALIDESASR